MNTFLKYAGSFLLLVFMAMTVCSTNAYAEMEKPSKENFVAAWVEHVKTSPHTKRMEKTSEPGVYLFETDLFPYNGRLKILNVLINDYIDIPYHFGGDVFDHSLAMGVAEIELMDAPDDFYVKLPYSTYFWKENNSLFYIKEANQWMSYAVWQDYYYSTEISGECSTKKKAFYNDLKYLVTILPPVTIILVLVFVIVSRRKIVARYENRYDLMIERQKEMLDLMKEQTELLRKTTKDKQ